MKVIIAGGRDNHDRGVVGIAVLASGFEITEVVSGGAPGVDTSGEIWARIKKLPLKRFPADWATFGKAGGPLRNGQMADYVGAEGGLIAIWDGHSHGTKNMIEQATAKGLKVFIHRI